MLLPAARDFPINAIPGLQLSGLASGLDWRSLVDKLIEAERLPQNQLRAEKSKGAQKTTALDSIKTQFTSLQSAMQSLGAETGDVFTTRSAKLANANSSWLATASPGAPTGNYRIAVTQLAAKAQLAGSVDAGRGLSATSDVSGLDDRASADRRHHHARRVHR